MFGGRSRTCSESSEGGAGGGDSGQRLGTSAPVGGGFLTAGLLGQKAAQNTANNNNNSRAGGTAYDLEGKFTYSQVSFLFSRMSQEEETNFAIS